MAHHWARELPAPGHDVPLMPPSLREAVPIRCGAGDFLRYWGQRPDELDNTLNSVEPLLGVMNGQAVWNPGRETDICELSGRKQSAKRDRTPDRSS